MYERPKAPEEAKALAQGHPGVEMKKYPLKFVTTTYFGDPPQSGMPASINTISVYQSTGLISNAHEQHHLCNRRRSVLPLGE